MKHILFFMILLCSIVTLAEQSGREVVNNYCRKLLNTEESLISCLKKLSGNSDEWNHEIASTCVELSVPSLAFSCLEKSRNKIYTGQQLNKCKSIVKSYNKYPGNPWDDLKKCLSTGKLSTDEIKEPKIESPTQSGLSICDKIKKFNSSINVTCNKKFKDSKFHPDMLKVCQLTAGYKTWFDCLTATEEKSVYPEIAAICADADKISNRKLFECIGAATVEGTGVQNDKVNKPKNKVQ